MADFFENSTLLLVLLNPFFVILSWRPWRSSWLFLRLWG
jgi:hypothetical protein